MDNVYDKHQLKENISNDDRIHTGNVMIFSFVVIFLPTLTGVPQTSEPSTVNTPRK